MSDAKASQEDSKQSDSSSPKGWTPPAGIEQEGSLPLASGVIDYTVHAMWEKLYEGHQPVAAMFHTAYLAKGADTNTRPLTFIFNGGPGAASVYLHLGALGPKIAKFTDQGETPPPPARLVDNHESWLAFSDLVFVDPIGTGFSRVIPHQKKDGKDADLEKATETFWEVSRDLTSICEFITRFLSRHKRWNSPIFVAGESYGGFRVASLVKVLQEDFGVGLCGAALISPAIELDTLTGSDYSVLHFSDMFPSMVSAAYHHGLATAPEAAESLGALLQAAETFASEEYPLLLLQGEAMPSERRATLIERMSSMCGLPADYLDERCGRVTLSQFCRQLLKPQGKVVAFHDAALTSIDPFPTRETQQGPDAAISIAGRVFASCINLLLRQELGVETELSYELINMKANTSWKDSRRKHFVENSKGVMDDFRYGMALNPHMKVVIFHGYQDLVTPYYASERLVQHMELDDSLRENLVLYNYQGGHMFYVWKESREAFLQDAASFYEQSLAHLQES